MSCSIALRRDAEPGGRGRTMVGAGASLVPSDDVLREPGAGLPGKGVGTIQAREVHRSANTHQHQRQEESRQQRTGRFDNPRHGQR